MKRIMLLLALVALAGCSSTSGGRAGSPAHSAALAAQDTESRYEYQLDYEYSDGAVTPFLHLVEVTVQ